MYGFRSPGLHRHLHPSGNSRSPFIKQYSYYSIPDIFTLLDTGALEASGILAVFNTPPLANRGRGVLIGLIDTGIDYTNPLFLYPDGTTRIASLWDQTIPADTASLPPGVPDYSAGSGAGYGTEFSRSRSTKPWPPAPLFPLFPPGTQTATAPS